MDPEKTPFADLDAFLALRRVSGLALSPDGSRLVVAVTALDEKRTAYRSSLWEVDPAGEQPAHRLTWGAKSESSPHFLPDGALIFSSARPYPDATAGEDTPAGLWLLPVTGGEARPFASRPGGIGAVAVARQSGTVVVASPTLPSAETDEQDADRRKARSDNKVSAVLHDSYPIRFWDHDLGPESDRLFVGTPGVAMSADADQASADLTNADQTGARLLELRDLTGHIGLALGEDGGWDVSPDGSRVVVSWQQPEPHGSIRYLLQLIDIATGGRRVLLDDPGFEYLAPTFSPDGRKVALLSERRAEPGQSVDQRLTVLHLDTGELHDAAPAWDRWPAGQPVWTPDGAALLVVADDNGRAPVWRIDLDTRTAVRLTSDDAAYSDLRISPDGEQLYALHAGMGSPPAPVRLDPAQLDQKPTQLLGPVEAPPLPGTVTEVTTIADDGTGVRGWLALPAGADAEHPAPLLVWIHGGPLGSWNAWSWRWNPWLAVARGYAVLMPDPALSTGYGLAAIRRGWGRWGDESYTDTMAITDAVVAREDIDAGRTAAMGGSFGGYLANWIAGHTDRFRGIVSHAGLWALDQFGPTTDAYYYWRREMTEEMATAHSPHRYVDQIRTPMLVIHGERDYRVPIGEALRLWAELSEHDDTGSVGRLPHRFLLFPDENHWILKPQNAKLWYQTVFAFLAQTVHGEPWQPPDLLC
jgi:dipeptidyl aminopeptidase/acylaminoacyl peptidase